MPSCPSSLCRQCHVSAAIISALYIKAPDALPQVLSCASLPCPKPGAPNEGGSLGRTELLLTPLKLLEALASRLLTSVWKALANVIRRDILDLLATGPQTTSELSEAFPDLSRFAIMRHLKVLEEADLLAVRRAGRQRFNYLNPVPIQQISDRWISRYQRPWTEALVDVKRELESR